MLVSLLDKREIHLLWYCWFRLTFQKVSDDLRIPSSTCLLVSLSLLCMGNKILITSLLFIFSNYSLVYVVIFKPNSYQNNNSSCKVKTKILLYYQQRPHATAIYGKSQKISVFKPNWGKYGPVKLRIRALFTQCIFFWFAIKPENPKTRHAKQNPKATIVDIILPNFQP